MAIQFQFHSNVTAELKSAKAHGEGEYYDTSLRILEAIIKQVASNLITCIPKSTHFSERYELEHALLRSSGIGDWVTAIQRITAGNLNAVARNAPGLQDAEIGEFTQRFLANSEEHWQSSVASSLIEATKLIYPGSPDRKAKVSLLDGFQSFALLRNKGKGHGATLFLTKARAGSLLGNAVESLLSHLSVLRMPLIGVRSNLVNGSPEPYALNEAADSARLEALRDILQSIEFVDGVYCVFQGSEGAWQHSYHALVRGEEDCTSISYANGSPDDKKSTVEFLDHFTSAVRRVEVQEWSEHPNATRRPSETSGLNQLRELGKAYTNAPTPLAEYVSRPKLEKELLASLTHNRRHIVSLKGSGGIGKTSLALEAVRQLCANGEFDLILWFSSRDLDLLESRTVSVRQDIYNKEDIDRVIAQLLPQLGEPVGTLQGLLGRTDLGRILCVFDNFETVRDPEGMFDELDSSLQQPHKFLFTSRHREFRGDHDITVEGMTREEFDTLTSRFAEITGGGDGKVDIDQVWKMSEGHPYIAKVLLSVSRAGLGVKGGLKQRDDVLPTLFSRTYDRLTVMARHVFLLLCTTKADVLEVGLEAALNSIEQDEWYDLGDLVDELARFSLVEIHRAEGVRWIHVPNPARLFGKEKLSAYPNAVDISQQGDVLQLLGSQKASLAPLSLETAAESFWKNMRPRLEGPQRSQYLEIASEFAERFPPLLNKIADFEYKCGNNQRAIRLYQRRLEISPDADTWCKLAQLYEGEGLNDQAIQAWARRATADGATTIDAVHAAYKILDARNREVDFTPVQRRTLAEPIYKRLLDREGELDAEGLSKLCWLLLNSGDDWKQAAGVLGRGLERFPDNIHLQKLDNKYRKRPSR